MTKYRSKVDGRLYYCVKKFKDKGSNWVVLRHWIPWKKRYRYDVEHEASMDIIFKTQK